MSRAVAAIVVLALAATLSFIPVIGPIGDGRAAAADCTWQRHAKRVGKRVKKRDGRVRRVVRVKRWWTCDQLAAPAAPANPPASLPPPTPPLGSEPEPPPRRVSVKAGDATPEAFSFILSRPFVVAGAVTVELNNQNGQDPHNLNLASEGDLGAPLEVGEAGPGESRVGRFGLSPGTYRLWCSLPQHEEWGMSVDLEVREG